MLVGAEVHCAIVNINCVYRTSRFPDYSSRFSAYCAP